MLRITTVTLDDKIFVVASKIVTANVAALVVVNSNEIGSRSHQRLAVT